MLTKLELIAEGLGGMVRGGFTGDAVALEASRAAIFNRVSSARAFKKRSRSMLLSSTTLQSGQPRSG